MPGMKSAHILLAVAFCVPALAARDARSADEPQALSKSGDVDKPAALLEYSEPKTYQLKITLTVSAPAGPLKNVAATMPVPVKWPEQDVQLLDEEKPRGTSTRDTRIKGRGAMMIFSVPLIRAGDSIECVRIYELTRKRIRLAADPTTLRAPTRFPRELREYLTSAPGVEIDGDRVAQLAATLVKPDAEGWENARSFYDWYRRNLKYKSSDFLGAEGVLKGGVGDCEDMTALFVALCRSSKIPARTVWIEQHAYPEFYLETDKGEGVWIPVQSAGPDWFGEMADYRPILQKGNKFKNPFSKQYIHHIPQTARAFGGAAKLAIERRIIDPEKLGKQPGYDDVPPAD